MKKTHIFLIFLLFFSFCTLIFPQKTYAEIEGHEISVICKISETPYSLPQETENYVSSKRTLTMDYSYFTSGGCIHLSSEITAIEELETSLGAIYNWTIGGKTVSTAKDLVIYSKFNDSTIDKPLINVGTTKVILTIFDQNSDQKESIDVNLIITDNTQCAKMQHFSSEIPSVLDSTTTNVSFYSYIPTTSSTITYSWLVKTPINVNYITASNENTFVFDRANFLSNYGYGTYKVFAVGVNQKSKETHHSSTYILNIQPNNNLIIAPGAYTISSKKVENTMAQIEAFEYSLSNTTNMIPENIIWYINGIKVACGEKFIYEPTTTDQYKVTAKYLSMELDNFNEQPKTTGMYILYISIAVTVVVVGIILLISIKVSNKKRDVVW